MDYNDYIKDAENKLYEYGNYQERKNILIQRLKIAEMRGCPKDISAVDFTKIGHGSYSQEALNDLLEAGHIIKQLNKLENEKQTIANVLEAIKKDDELLYNFLVYKYIENMSIKDTIEKVGYSSNSNRQIYKIKEKSLRKFVMYYWCE